MIKTPLIHKESSEITRCAFGYRVGDEYKIKRSDIFVNIPASTDPTPANWERFPEYERGWIAVLSTLDRRWFLADAAAYIRYGSLSIRSNTDQGCHEIAFGVDQRMKREDIDGATIAYIENGKILFAHATVEEHHDRILLAETAISVVFEELLMDRLIRMDVVDIAGRSTSNRRGELTILGHINSFRNDCMKLARYNEGQLHIGEHVKNPEEFYIYKMVENAFALCVKKWKAEKPAEYNQISDRIASIEKRLKSRHSFKRRWEIPTVFPNAERTETAENE